jgi:hypothetical protein
MTAMPPETVTQLSTQMESLSQQLKQELNEIGQMSRNNPEAGVVYQQVMPAITNFSNTPVADMKSRRVALDQILQSLVAATKQNAVVQPTQQGRQNPLPSGNQQSQVVLNQALTQSFQDPNAMSAAFQAILKNPVIKQHLIEWVSSNKAAFSLYKIKTAQGGGELGSNNNLSGYADTHPFEVANWFAQNIDKKQLSQMLQQNGVNVGQAQQPLTETPNPSNPQPSLADDLSGGVGPGSEFQGETVTGEDPVQSTPIGADTYIGIEPPVAQETNPAQNSTITPELLNRLQQEARINPNIKVTPNKFKNFLNLLQQELNAPISQQPAGLSGVASVSSPKIKLSHHENRILKRIKKGF